MSGDNKAPHFDDQADQLRYELQSAAPFCPELTPDRIEALVAEFRESQAKGNAHAS